MKKRRPLKYQGLSAFFHMLSELLRFTESDVKVSGKSLNFSAVYAILFPESARGRKAKQGKLSIFSIPDSVKKTVIVGRFSGSRRNEKGYMITG